LLVRATGEFELSMPSNSYECALVIFEEMGTDGE